MRMEAARPEDAASVAALLEAAGLPSAHIEQYLEHFLVVRKGGQVLACAGMEIYGDSCLLRSLAVRADHRGRGLGGALVERLLERARSLGLGEAVALTGTAVDFARRFGFEVVPRDAVGEQVRASWEFSEGACRSAACMRLALRKMPGECASATTKTIS